MEALEMKTGRELPSSSKAPCRRHNFTFPTPGWGAGRILRSIRVAPVVGSKSRESPDEVPSPSELQSILPQEVPSPSEVQPILPVDVLPSPSKVQSISPEAVPSPSKVRSISPEKADNAELPWNLRRRRATYKEKASKSPDGASVKAKIKFSVSLSFKEIEADFLSMSGKKPYKRPKKRPKHVQKQLDVTCLFDLSFFSLGSHTTIIRRKRVVLSFFSVY